MFTEYKKKPDKSSYLVREGCDKTVKIMCSPEIKPLLHQAITSMPGLLPDKKADIIFYLESNVCNINNKETIAEYISSNDYNNSQHIVPITGSNFNTHNSSIDQ